MTCREERRKSGGQTRGPLDSQNGELSRNPAAMTDAPDMGPKTCPAPQTLKAKDCPDFPQDARTPWGRVFLKTLLHKALWTPLLGTHPQRPREHAVSVRKG